MDVMKLGSAQAACIEKAARVPEVANTTNEAFKAYKAETAKLRDDVMTASYRVTII